MAKCLHASGWSRRVSSMMVSLPDDGEPQIDSLGLVQRACRVQNMKLLGSSEPLGRHT